MERIRGEACLLRLDLLLRLGAITTKSGTSELRLKLGSRRRHELRVLRGTKGVCRLSWLESRFGHGLNIDLREGLTCLLRILLRRVLSHGLLLVFN
jgi:hypothetical protein